MNAPRRPIAVLLLSCLYMAVGAIGLAVNLPKLIAMEQDSVWVELTELLALVAGAFLFRGRNWARWLALAWMAFHVAISFPVVHQLIGHAVIFALIAWILLRPDAQRFFAPAKPKTQ
jgi:hypothetical protein